MCLGVSLHVEANSQCQMSFSVTLKCLSQKERPGSVSLLRKRQESGTPSFWMFR